MTSDPSLFVKKIRHLSLALIVSGALNIGVLSALLYWVLRENPPTPYCEHKPASSEQQQIPLADQRGCVELLTQLSKLSFSQLVGSLSHAQLIENGYAERDLALACLIAFHHFDLQRALPKTGQPQQQRLLTWKPKGQETSTMLVVYPDLTEEQFESIIQFAKKERWPLTAEGLFLLLKEQKVKGDFDDHLLETFVLTPEFWTVELLFNRSGQRASKQKILTVLLEGDWTLLKQFVDQQRQVHDSSDARRQKFLLDYIRAGSPSAATLLLKNEWEFALKKLDDQQVIMILQLMPEDLPEAMTFAKEMLISPRSTSVWQQASIWLYTQAGEAMPKNWTHYAALVRFVPDKASIELVSKPPVVMSVAITPQLPLGRTTVIGANSMKSNPVPKPLSMIKPVAQKTTTSQSLKKVVESKKTIEVKKAIEVKKSEPVTSIQPHIYVVQEGDSLWKISQRFGVKVDDIKALNHMKSDVLKKGMVLKVPRPVATSGGSKKS